LRAAPTDRAELTSLALLLVLAACPAHAERRAPHGGCTREDAESSSAGAGAIRAEISRPLPRPVALPAAVAPPPRPALELHFAPPTDLGHRLRPTLQHYSMLALWDSPHVRIYLGLDRSGRAGLHVQQQDPRDWSAPRVATVRTERAPRAAPLSSP
jgi:hypothetical protein